MSGKHKRNIWQQGCHIYVMSSGFADSSHLIHGSRHTSPGALLEGNVNNVCMRKSRTVSLLITGLMMLALEGTAAKAEEGSISIELNKLEAHDSDCRAYFVIDNKNDTTYDALKLDLVLFRPDGVIGQRFAVELAPLKAKKRTVKLFDVAGTTCSDVGSFLINDVMECKASTGDVADCLQEISVSSRTENQLTK